MKYFVERLQDNDHVVEEIETVEEFISLIKTLLADHYPSGFSLSDLANIYRTQQSVGESVEEGLDNMAKALEPAGSFLLMVSSDSIANVIGHLIDDDGNPIIEAYYWLASALVSKPWQENRDIRVVRR